MRLLYNIAGLYRPAGMERVLSNKVNWLAAQKGPDGEALYEIVIATTDQRGREVCFPLDGSLRTVDLGILYEENNGGSFLGKVLHYPFKQMRHRRRLARLIRKERPDIVISMFCNDASFIPRLAHRTGAAAVLEIHFSRFKRLQYGRTGLWALADRLRSELDLHTVRRFDRFVVLTQEDRGYWGELPNIEVIPNARTFRIPEEKLCFESRRKEVIAVGRYSRQKGLERLIEAWNMVARECPDWTLRLVGDGEERDFLQKRIQDYGLEDRVILGRSESDMESVYCSASILALSSRYEGLPMVLLEAQAAGLPAVSFECKCGPRDVITDGVDGFLVEEGNVSDFADRLFELMRDEDLRRRMGEAAYRASERFDEEKIMKRWTDLLERL